MARATSHTSIDALRAHIDRIDEKLLALLNQRARLALHIGERKRHAQAAIYIPDREKRIFERLAAVNNGPLDIESIRPIFREIIAACLSLDPARIVTRNHEPVRASVGVEFVLVEVEPDALAGAAPDLAAYRRAAAAHSELQGRLSIFLYAADGDGIRARMFAPLAGTWEDPATGSANATLAALRLSLSDAPDLAYEAVQGVEMGRESRLKLRAWREEDGVRASVGGQCVPIFRGSVTL